MQGRAKIIQGADIVDFVHADDSMQSKDCIGSSRYLVWSDDRLVWVVKCLIMVERS